MVAVPARAQPKLGRLSVSRWAVALALVGLAGIAARIWIYRSILGVPSSDEALVGLWAIHASHGDFTTFFWGLRYGGTQEPFLSVPLFLLFGPSWLALRIVPIVLSGITALLVWRVGRRAIGERAGATAAALFWVWPPYDLVTETRAGFYAGNLFYCTLLVLLTLRIVERPTLARVGAFGFVLGLAYWETSQITPIAVPLIVWALWRRPRAARHVWLAAPLAVAGAFPWLLWNLRHSFDSLDLLSYDVQSSYWHRLRIFVSPLVPMSTGLRTPFSQTPVLPGPLTNIVYALLLLLFVYGAVRYRRTNAGVLYLVALVFPFLYALSPWTVESGDPRYLIVLTPVLALLVAQLATRGAAAVALVLVAAALSVVVLHRFVEGSEKAVPGTGAPRDFRPMISELDRLGVRYVYSTHWIAYRLAFETNERIIGVKNDFTSVRFANGQAQPSIHYVRYPPYERKVRAGKHAFVFYSRAVPPIANDLRGWGYEPHPADGVVIYSLPPGR
jgi:hypothetical protein